MSTDAFDTIMMGSYNIIQINHFKPILKFYQNLLKLCCERVK